jgi:putative membrane protein
MSRSTSILFFLFALVTLQACQSNRQASNVSKAVVDDNDLLFIKSGEESTLASVKASGLAIANSKNQRVIQFAKLMIDDHTMLADDFKKLKIDNAIQDSVAISPMHQQIINDLDAKRAGAFDRAYIQLVINDHTEQIALYKTAGSDKKNTSIADFANKMLPGLQAHLDTAKFISTILK